MSKLEMDVAGLTIDAAVNAVACKADEWFHLPTPKRCDLIEECLILLEAHRQECNDAALQRRGYVHSESCSEDVAKTERALVPCLGTLLLASWLSSLRETLSFEAKHGSYPRPHSVKKQADGRFRVRLGGGDYLTWVVDAMKTVELVVEKDPSAQAGTAGGADDAGAAELGQIQYTPEQQKEQCSSGVAAVLGPGNMDAPVDVLTAMFVMRKVAVFKFSPIVEGLGHPLAEVFAPLISRGYLAFVTGGASEGAMLLHHPAVNLWFMTGDIRTAYRILWGTPAPPLDISVKPLYDKPCVIELGNASPYIIAPGYWTEAEMYKYARHLAHGMLFNGGHVCVHIQVLVTCKRWPQRRRFLDILATALDEAQLGGLFYPGASEAMQRLLSRLKSEGLPVDLSARCGGSAYLLEDIPTSSLLLKEESFCRVTGEVAIDCESEIPTFLHRAVDLVNEELLGSLCASVVAKTKTSADENALEEAISKLKYGSIGVNGNGVSAIMSPAGVWGGYPEGASVTNLQSGLGWFGNTCGYKKVLKSIVRYRFNGPQLMMMAIPRPAQAPRLEKLTDRATAALCHRLSKPSFLAWAKDWIKLGSGAVLGI